MVQRTSITRHFLLSLRREDSIYTQAVHLLVVSRVKAEDVLCSVMLDESDTKIQCVSGLPERIASGESVL